VASYVDPIMTHLQFNATEYDCLIV